ncbi:MAG: hypothetical protein AABY95_02975 [Pseudomonadota bacterium]
MLFRNTKIFSLLWLSIGIGLSGYYGVEWYEQPSWTRDEIEQSVELNLAVDLARMGPHLRPKGDKLDALRQLVRGEVETQIRREQSATQRGLAAGVAMLLLGLVPLLLERKRGV